MDGRPDFSKMNKKPYQASVIMHGNAVKQLFADAGRNDVDMSDIDDDAVYVVENGKYKEWGQD